MDCYEVTLNILGTEIKFQCYASSEDSARLKAVVNYHNDDGFTLSDIKVVDLKKLN